MKNIEIQKLEDFVLSFFCVNADLFFLGEDISLESEAEYFNELMSCFWEILEQISNRDEQNESLRFDLINDGHLEEILHPLVSNKQEAKRKCDYYCLNIANIDEKIVISAHMKYMIDMIQSPNSQQLEYLNSFISDYGLLEFESKIQNLYNSIRKKNKEKDILGDW